MRVFAATIYTITALLARDLSLQAIAASVSPDTTSPVSPEDTTPSEKAAASSELVPSVAPAEQIPVKPAWAETQPPAQSKPITSSGAAASIAPPAGVESRSTASTAPSSAASPTVQTTSNSNPTPAAFTPTPENMPVLERISTAPPPSDQRPDSSEPLVEWLNSSGRSNPEASESTEHLTATEIEELQGWFANQSDRAATAEATPSSANGAESSPSPLVSPNLAEDAATVFGGNGNQPITASQNSSSTNTAQPNTALSEPVETNAPPSGQSHTDSPSLSVYTIQATPLANSQPTGSSARNYYNLTVRPPAQLTNGNVSLLFPLAIPAAITSAFGWRVHPVTGDMRFHSGTDIGAPQGTPVLAAFDGKVEIADFAGGYGLTVMLQHHQGTIQTLYAHLSEIFVRPGEQIKQGEVIGRVGSTGLSTGPHLHFEVRRLTQEGWIAMDAGSLLEYALAQFGQFSQVAQSRPELKLPAVFKSSGKFLQQVEIASQKEAQQATRVASQPRSNQ